MYRYNKIVDHEMIAFKVQVMRRHELKENVLNVARTLELSDTLVVYVTGKVYNPAFYRMPRRTSYFLKITGKRNK